jgi:hypothetical protein
MYGRSADRKYLTFESRTCVTEGLSAPFTFLQVRGGGICCGLLLWGTTATGNAEASGASNCVLPG